MGFCAFGAHENGQTPKRRGAAHSKRQTSLTHLFITPGGGAIVLKIGTETQAASAPLWHTGRMSTQPPMNSELKTQNSVSRKSLLFLVAFSASALLGPVSASAQVLVADDFENPTFSPADPYLANYQLNGQSGTLSPLSY